MSAVSVVIEQYRRGMEEDVVNLLRECFQSYRRYGVTAEEWLGYGNRDPGVKPENTFVAYVDGEPAGLVQIVERRIRIVGGEVVSVAGVANVCVHPRYRGLGLSKKILERVHEHYRSRGFAVAGLLAGYTSLAHGVYQRLGYVEVLHLESLALSLNDVNYLLNASVREGRWSTRAVEEGDLNTLTELYEEATKNLSGVIARDEEYWVSKIIRSHPLHTFFYSKNVPEHKRVVIRDGVVRAYALIHTWREEPRLLEPGKALIKEVHACGGVRDHVLALLAVIRWLGEAVKPRSVVVYTHLARELREVLGVGVLLGCGEVYMFKPLEVSLFAERVAKGLNNVADDLGLPCVTLLVGGEYFGYGNRVVEVDERGLVALALASDIEGAIERGWVIARGNSLLLRLLLQSIKPYINYVDRW